MISACGVLCSDCPAYQGQARGLEHQMRTVEAWIRIYNRPEAPEDIRCGGCLSPDDEVFYTSRTCQCRLCCRAKGLESCAGCPEEDCARLKEAQAVWDEVPALINTLSPADFDTYARPYCDHRQRLAEARARSLSENRGDFPELPG